MLPGGSENGGKNDSRAVLFGTSFRNGAHSAGNSDPRQGAECGYTRAVKNRAGCEIKNKSKRKRKDKHRKCRHEHRFILRFELDSVSGICAEGIFHPDSHIFSVAEKYPHSA